MLASRLKVVACVGLATLWLSTASAATLIPVAPVSGATSTTAYAINNSNIIGGSFSDNTGTHAFFGTIAGSYSTFDYKGPGVYATEIRGINDTGTIAGYSASTKRILAYEWERDPAGNLVTITGGKTDAPLDGIAQQITNSGVFVGDWYSEKPPNNRYAYVGKNGEVSKNLKLPFGSHNNVARGMNNAGAIVGSFRDSFGSSHGFLLINGTATQIDYPDSREVTTYLQGINDNGLVTGFWGDRNAALHGFKLDTTMRPASTSRPGHL